jgi:uncharacterized protein (TIGR02118 family)
MYRVTISYGTPLDPDAFDDHYRAKHLSLVKDIPGVQKFVAGPCESLDGNPPASYYLAQLYFADRDAAAAGLTSQQGQAAAADIANFASGGATLTFSDEALTFP